MERERRMDASDDRLAVRESAYLDLAIAQGSQTYYDEKYLSFR